MKKSVLSVLDRPIDTLARDTAKLPNREALKLYRDILKFSKMLSWTNEQGVSWYHFKN